MGGEMGWGMGVVGCILEVGVVARRSGVVVDWAWCVNGARGRAAESRWGR
jgi:hypothetical protein